MISDSASLNFFRHEEPPKSVAKKYFDILKAVETLLVEGDDKHSILSAYVELLYIKPENQWTQKSYDDVFAFIKKHFLPDNNMVEDWYVSQKLISDARPKKIKNNEGNVDDGMVVYMENVLKIKLEGFKDQEKASKLILICTTSKDHSRKKIGCENGYVLEKSTPTADGRPAPIVAGGGLGNVWNPIYNQKKIYIKVVSEKPPNKETCVKSVWKRPEGELFVIKANKKC
ncbi:hypothetical protein M9H77_03376 [Catharanthus roseus]|uniref:Uncharacterized protein n=1 Tax=Catharanthus roseus TaxID=4058 RepID=A0ACC0CAZ3_CATRO|nr:hypothetical protein M9H77_03376 [Catharanthus roseus]